MNIDQKNNIFIAKLAILGLAASVFCSLTLSNYVGAITGWQAGNIISDSVMTNNSSMTKYQIQKFLNSHVSNCDTYGMQLSEFGGPDLNGDGKVLRWEWGKSRYNQTKFVCLKNYSKNGKSAAQIIKDVSNKYGINPQVMIVLLQKEQGLVNDTWPLWIQYRSATGYGCPDTAPCASQYYGLTNQLDWAAKMFRSILDDSQYWYTPYETGWNYIQYSPVKSCGGSNVYIKNRATQALYNYTPYQPNKGALDAGWGTAPCGAYGNRNFYLYFTNWFGSTQKSNFTSLESRRWMVANVNTYKYNPFTGQRVDSQIPGGTDLRFISKTYANGKWYLRTEWDHSRNEPKGIPLNDLKEISYTPMSTPRLMKLRTDAQKIDPARSLKYGNSFSLGMVTYYDQKTTVNGTTFLRSKYDTDHNNILAFKLSNLEDFSFDSMVTPRWLVANKDIYAKDLQSSDFSSTSTSYTNNHEIYFDGKVNIQGKIYLKARDLPNSNKFVYPLESFDNLRITFTPMVSPRTMKLSQDTWKIDPETQVRIDENDDPFPAGKEIYFSDKITINKKVYLRSKYDAIRNYSFVIPFEKLDEV